MIRIVAYNIKKQRNEYGRQIRKDYESHRLPDVRRKEIKELVPMFDGICRTITTIADDNLILEVYDDKIQAGEAEDIGKMGWISI